MTHGDALTDALTPDQRAAAAAGTLAYDSAHPPQPAKPVSKWAVHRRLYDWVIGFAKHRHATSALAALSFAESSFFPIPPDVLLMPLCLGNRRKAWWFAAVCTLASVAGGVLGYAIGYYAWEALQGAVYSYVPGFNAEKFATVNRLYDEWGVLILFAAAFTPIPFKVFTVVGGVMHQALLPFILVSTVGRGLRFFLVAGLMWKFGEKIVPLIDKYFNLVCIAATVLGVAGFAAIKLLH